MRPETVVVAAVAAAAAAAGSVAAVHETFPRCQVRFLEGYPCRPDQSARLWHPALLRT